MRLSDVIVILPDHQYELVRLLAGFRAGQVREAMHPSAGPVEDAEIFRQAVAAAIDATQGQSWRQQETAVAVARRSARCVIDRVACGRARLPRRPRIALVAIARGPLPIIGT